MNSSFINDDFTSFIRRRTSSANSQHSTLDFTASSINSTFSIDPSNDNQNEEKLYELFPKTNSVLPSPNSKYTSNFQNEPLYTSSTLDCDTKFTNDINTLFLPEYSAFLNVPPPSPPMLSPSYYQDYSFSSQNYSTDPDSSPYYLNRNFNTSLSSESEFTYPYNSRRNRNVSTNSLDFSDFDLALSNLSISDLNSTTSPNNTSTMSFGTRTLKYSNNTSSQSSYTCCSQNNTVCQSFQSNNTLSSSSSTATTVDQYPKTTICTFCRKNNERPSVYLSHVVRRTVGNKKIVTCPILRSYVCPLCGVSGDYAHTLAYCPKTKKNNSRMPSISIALKNTRVQSKGIKKY